MAMARKRKYSRLVMTLATVAIVAGVLAAAFWPRPRLVDLDVARRGAMQVTINEEGRTRVQEPYVVSAPIAGELQRVTVHAGDKVLRGETVVAAMRPVNPSVLDVRTHEQARAAVTAAEAALRVARADLNAAIANRDFADSELARVRRLVDLEISSQVALERAEQANRVAQASFDTVEAAIAMREAELNNARAKLIGFNDQGLAGALTNGGSYSPAINLKAPIDGTILKIIQQSETTLQAGAPILEIGDVEGDLEIVAELLSSDAVQVTPGDRVEIVNWGGGTELQGIVDRIDPYGYTKYSALGVEEQRVLTTIRFDGDGRNPGNLGHGYRVELRIVVWSTHDALIVPSSALFRHGGAWAVYGVADGHTRLREVAIGHNNGVEAEVLSGIEPGEQVVLYPSSGLSDGAYVAQRVTD